MRRSGIRPCQRFSAQAFELKVSAELTRPCMSNRQPKHTSRAAVWPLAFIETPLSMNDEDEVDRRRLEALGREKEGSASGIKGGLDEGDRCEVMRCVASNRERGLSECITI